MEEESVRTIEELLSELFVFDENYKETILKKSLSLDSEGLVNLIKILSEIENWQKNLVVEKLKQDPGFLDKIIENNNQKNVQMRNLREELLKEKDHMQISKVLSFIDKL